MEPEHWKRVEALFHRAADLELDQRATFLDAECGADQDLRSDVERLLRDDRTGDDMLARLEEQTRAALEDPMLGRRVGVYRLVARLAVGGMGVVYRAERTDGLFEQEVAVKLIRTERATDGMMRRFQQERRTLAALHHPGIARLYDGGTTDDGRPYLVMELVHGVPIDSYCDRERLTVTERLRLFVQVCRAVQFAHQNLVVHRDLKPSNILIDEQGMPRLLDFGISHLIEDDQDDPVPDPTRTMARVLTPEYASPEQLAGGAVTTALDVYSLGVVLYELLTGHRPFRYESRNPSDWQRIVNERTPLRPSTVVARSRAEEGGLDRSSDSRALAARAASTPRGLKRRLRGDLDRIVLMALRKEPERRYASVQEFSDDLERHLAGLPVRARPDSLAYRSSRFVRRNRVAVASLSAVIGALLFGLLAARRSEARAKVQEASARAQADHARIEADSFQSIADFLMDAFLPSAPSQDEAWQQQARERVLLHAERVRRQYPHEDHIRANLLDTLGKVCSRLDLPDEAERLAREAQAIRAQTFGEHSLEYAISLRSLGQLDYQRGDYASAAQKLGEALDLHRTCEPGTHTDVSAVANDLAACLRNLGREAEAEQLHLEALAWRRGTAEGTLPVAESLNNLGCVHLGAGDHERAVGEFQEALTIRRDVLGPQHLLTLQTTSNLAGALWRLGRRDEAFDLMRQAEEGYRALHLDGEEGLAQVLASIASMQTSRRELDAARSNLAEAIELQEKRLGPDHPVLATTLINLAVVEHALRREEEAGELWVRAVRIRRSSPSALRELSEALYGYAVFLRDRRSFGEAVPLLEESIRAARSLTPSPPLFLARSEVVLGSCLANSGRSLEGREHLREAVRLFEASPDASDGELDAARRRLEAVESAAGG